MTTISLRSARSAFILFLVALTAFTVVESAVGARPATAAADAEGLSACGTVEQPCQLEAVAVIVPARAPRVLLAAQEGLSACGTENEPCVLEAVEVTAEASGSRLASLEHAARMALRVGS